MRALLTTFLAFAMISFGSANTIKSGLDIQAAIDKAIPGDTIVVGPGAYSFFEVDKPLTILGQDGPILHAIIQRPAIKIISQDVIISGFKIQGVGKDSNAKFNYFMENPTSATGLQLNLPNAAIIVTSSNVSLKDSTIFGAQVGILAENIRNLSIQKLTLESCDSGALLKHCHTSKVMSCNFFNCKKYGLDVEQCREITLYNNSIANATNAGLLLKDTEGCNICDNVLKGNTFGLSAWNSSFNQINRNFAYHNYYGILITKSSNNNTIMENVAEENTRNEIVKGFGIGISLQENSSYNTIIRNTAKRNFNGLEVSRGCKFNAVYQNNASDNNHGIRLNENRNNLIFGNSFDRNNINAYENASRNTWNTTFGNYYGDYEGYDRDEDGIGDQPYMLPGQDSNSFDFRPLMIPNSRTSLDSATLMEEVKRYTKSEPSDEAILPYRMEGGTIVITSQKPTSPPKWHESKPII